MGGGRREFEGSDSGSSSHSCECECKRTDVRAAHELRGMFVAHEPAVHLLMTSGGHLDAIVCRHAARLLVHCHKHNLISLHLLLELPLVWVQYDAARPHPHRTVGESHLVTKYMSDMYETNERHI